MRRFTFLLMIWICAWAIGTGIIQTRQEEACRENDGYIHTGICCLNCPAGTFVKQPCSQASNRSECEICDSGYYTEHSNGLLRCLRCIVCRSDQEQVEECSTTGNTQCQCKPGTFCLPDQACEICKHCSKCKDDEQVVKSCTAKSNTVCEKKDPGISTVTIVSVSVLILMLLFLMGFLYWWTSPECNHTVKSSWWRKVNKTTSGNFIDEEMQNDLNRKLETGAQNRLIPAVFIQTVEGRLKEEEEEDRGLGQSIPNTANSSRESLPLLQQSSALENERPRRLVPVNGEESLRKSFDLFTEIDMNYQKRFFRRIGLKDNDIRSADDFRPEDRMYELLRVWIEKEGLVADFNDLIAALLDLKQRLTAENIITKVLADGLFTYEME